MIPNLGRYTGNENGLSDSQNQEVKPTLRPAGKHRHRIAPGFGRNLGKFRKNLGKTRREKNPT